MPKSTRKPLSKTKRALVYAKYNGRCGYCGKLLETVGSMTVDHIEPVRLVESKNELKFANDKNNVDNLMPSCYACNTYKGGLSLEHFREQLKKLINEKQRSLFATTTKHNLAINYGQIQFTNWNGVFYFEKYVEFEGIE